MKKNSFVAKLLAVVLGISVLATGCGSSASSSNKDSSAENDTKLTTVRVGVMTGYYDSWLATIGIEKGIYEKYGLDVQTTDFAAGINTVDALTTDQIDIGLTADFAGVNRIGNTQDKTTLRYFAGICYSNSQKLYVNPETIKDEKDLKGKVILELPGTVWEYLAAIAVQHAGYTNDDVEYKGVDTHQDGLAVAKKGDADAFFAAGENAVRLEEYGWTPLYSQGDIGINTYNLYMANQEYLDGNEETVESFIKATEEIIEYIDANQDEAADIIYDKTGVEKDVFLNQLSAITYEVDITQDTYDALQNVAEWSQENGYFNNAITVSDYIDTNALSAVYPDKVSYTEK